MIQLIVLLPLLAFLAAGISNRILGNTFAKTVTTGALFISCALSWIIFLKLMFGAPAENVTIADWMFSGEISVHWALKVDMLTGVMLVVVNTVSAFVHLYSWGYMAEDPDQPRFFAYLSLFTFAMLMLVTSQNLVQMYFGWEGVGLASYLLIGFWYERPSAWNAAIKSFVVNRVGDFGFILGIFALFLYFGTVDIDSILAAIPAAKGATFELFGHHVDVLTTAALLLFVGAVAKSAQVPLHVWLPDAMEGPTPVSALIHAATMVTAGVFLVCRMSPLYEASVVAATVVTVVGAFTAVFAATIATVQNDIKKVIAYSTCSQLGYMFFAAGVGAYGAAMFHLFTHAFFKALLFLCSGAVIHAMHGEQDMRFYGGLRKAIPWTFWAMVVGTISITGVNYTAGFYSKDAAIFAAFGVGTESGYFAYAMGVFAAFLTSFYSWRLMFHTFFGKARWGQSTYIQEALAEHAHDVHGAEAADGHEGHAGESAEDGSAGYHPHEAGLSMLIPLGVLSLGALVAGFIFDKGFVGVASFWQGTIVHPQALYESIEAVPLMVHYSPMLAMLIGLGIAWAVYIRNPGFSAKFRHQFRQLHTFLMHKWYFDELYDLLFVRFGKWIGTLFWQRGDRAIIDRYGPDGMANMISEGAGVASRFQSGLVYSYALVMLVGVAAFATWFVVR